MPRISDIELLDLPPSKVLAVRGRTDTRDIPSLLSEALNKIETFLARKGMTMSEVPYVALKSFASLDEKSRAANIEAGYAVADETQADDGIAALTLPRRKVVSCFYQGSNETMGEACEEPVELVQPKSLEMPGDAYEYYYSSPGCDREKMLTRIMLPLKQRENV